MTPLRSSVALAILLIVSTGPLHSDEKPISALFLGDNNFHHPRERSRQLIPVLATRGIQITYTERLEDLDPSTLSKYDCLIIFANQEHIEKPQEKALLEYVANGGGFLPIHCASYCFLNSPDYIALVGAQFKSHEDGRFRTRITTPDHPIMKNLEGFETWDETYVHTKHNEDRTILQVRREGDRDEP
jgi:type 1 glutamine amidotransferase